MTAGAMVEAYVAGPMVGDVAAVLVAVARFHVQNHAMRSRAPVALMCVQSVLLFVMMLMRPETGLVEDGVAVRVLRLVVLPVVIYVILPFALYTGGVVERMLAVCATTLAFCTTAFAAVGLASLRAHLLGAPPLVLTTVPLAEVLSGVSVLPGSMRTARAYAIGAMVVEIGLTLLLELMVSERARRYYAHADFLRNDRFLLFSLFQFAILGVSLTMAVSVFADGRQYLFGAAGLGVVCLFVDVVLFRSMEREYRARLDREASQLLQRELDECLLQYGEVAGYVESVARRNHDIRNQLAVVSALTRRGEFDAATRHLESVAAFGRQMHGDDRATSGRRR